MNLLIHGDCRQTLKNISIPQNSVVVTDPPFNVGYKYKTYKDKMREDDYLKMLAETCSGKAVLVLYPEMLHRFSIFVGGVPNRVVSWVYNSNTPRQHRDIGFYGVDPDFKKVLQPYKNPNDKRIIKRIESGKAGCKLYDWWNINQIKNVSKEKTNHPCQMPVEVMKNIIGILPDDITVIDPFMGSGTTGVACKMLGRNFIGIEMDDEYFNIASQRINNTEVTNELKGKDVRNSGTDESTEELNK